MITVSGIGSGLDIESLVTQLVAAERAPTENRLTLQDARLAAELSSFGVFKGALSSFQSSLAQLNTLGNFNQRITSSGNEDIATLTASSDAIPGSYDLGVTQLAKAHSLASAGYTELTDTVGEGVLTLRFGTTDYVGPDPGPESYNSFTVNPDRGVATITIDNTNNTLEGVRDAINNADIGVSATIVNDGSAYRLLLNSDSNGDANSIEISVSDTGDGNDTDTAGLSALAFNSAATNLEQTVAAQDAIFTVNGLSINSAENTVSGAIEGVDIELKDLTGATPINISIAEDRATVKEAISTFIEGYNQFIDTANAATAFDPTSRTAAPLQGDFSVRSIVGQLRQVLTNAVDGFSGPFSTLSEIGITTNTDGSLALDNSRLDTVLEENFNDIAGLFTAIGRTTDPTVEYLGSTDATVVDSYAVEVTQLATQGSYTGAAPLSLTPFPLIIDGNNDNFSVRVDGIESSTISLTQSIYATGADLAAEMQARINGDSTLASAGVSVAVAWNADRIEITSQSGGSSSNVEILTVDTNTTNDMGLSVGVGTAGVDVAGTIGGVAALVSGNVLTGAPGSGAEGLRLQINGGAIGPRGTVEFSRGVGYQLDALLTNFLQDDGILDARTDGIEERASEIEEAQERLDRRMEILETSLRARFTVLDTLLSQLQNTSSFLTQQLAALPEPNSINRN